MKKRFTLAALAALALGSLNAQAQFTVNGTLAAAEIGTGLGKYQLVSTYTNTHSIANRGLKALYMGTTATTLNVMLVASPEKTDYNALVMYFDLPNRTGTAANTRLAGGSDGTSQLRHRPTLDMPVDLGFRVTTSPLGGADLNSYYSKVDYTVAPNAAGKNPDLYLGPTNKTGTPLVITDAATGIVAARFAFQTSPTVTTNTSTGWEFEIPLASLGGAANGDLIRMMAAYVGDNGDFYSDILPQIAGQTTDLGTDPNFALIARSQFSVYQVGSGPLASRSAVAEALSATAYPNPLTAASQLSYTVADRSQPVSVEVYNTLGQRVLNLVNAQQAPGTYRASLADLQNLAPGPYLVKLQVGSQLTSRPVVVE
jgi:hypothetical protein